MLTYLIKRPMFIENFQQNNHALKTALENNSGLTIACYCADWCETCKQYHDDFQTLSQQFPNHLFVWIDIEDTPELLDDIDIDNFPTLLIQHRTHHYFFGVMLPHIQHLHRLIQTIQEHPNETLTHQAVPRPLTELI